MAEQAQDLTTIQRRQERRIRGQHGLTETQARILAPFIYGRVSK